MSPKMIIFDFDGVIINSIELQKMAFKNSCYKVTKHNNHDVARFFSYSGDSLFNIARKMNLPENFVYEYRKLTRQNLDRISICEGMLRVLDEIQNSKQLCSLCTGKDRERTIEILEYFDMKDYFDLIVCSDDVSNPKPDPECINKILEHFQLNSSDCIMIGDAKNDILCAKESKVSSFGVTWGCSGIDELKLYGPDKIINDTEELLEQISLHFHEVPQFKNSG